MSVAAIVLAAGASHRLGRPKQLISIRGRSLIENIVDEVRASRCDAVAVVLGAVLEDIAPVLTGRGVTLLLNSAWGEGIASSIRVGVRWAASHDAVLICVCDQPYLRTAHLDRLIAAHLTSGRMAASSYGGLLGVRRCSAGRRFPPSPRCRATRARAV